MTGSPVQLEIQFSSLDFPGRKVLYPFECAEVLGKTTEHIYNLMEEGALGYIDTTGLNNRSERRDWMVPIEAWKKFLSERSHPAA